MTTRLKSLLERRRERETAELAGVRGRAGRRAVRVEDLEGLSEINALIALQRQAAQAAAEDIAALETAVGNAQAALEQARRSAARARQLAKSGTIGKEEWELAELDETTRGVSPFNFESAREI